MDVDGNHLQYVLRMAQKRHTFSPCGLEAEVGVPFPHVQRGTQTRHKLEREEGALKLAFERKKDRPYSLPMSIAPIPRPFVAHKTDHFVLTPLSPGHVYSSVK